MKTAACRVIESVLGLPCWQVRWDRQVGLDLSFGPPRLVIREPSATLSRSTRVREQLARRGVHLKGSHWLVAYPTVWRLSLADGLTVRDTSSATRLRPATARLRGEKPMAFAIDAATGRTRILFDLGAVLDIQLRSQNGAPEELWSLQNRSRFASVYSGGYHSSGAVRRAGVPTPMRSSEFIVVAANAGWRRAAEEFENRAAKRRRPSV